MALSFANVSIFLVGAAALTLAAVGSPEERGRREIVEARAKAQASMATATPVAPPSNTVSGAGLTLTSVSLTLPSGDREYPAGPHSDAINNNCLSCHSAGMVLTQPRLSRAEWQGEVTKMVNTYKAPVDPASVGLIVDYLAQLEPEK